MPLFSSGMGRISLWFIFVEFIHCAMSLNRDFWLSSKAMEAALSNYDNYVSVSANSNQNYNQMVTKNEKNSNYSPFVSGTSFLSHCPHSCLNVNKCILDPRDVIKPGSCIFVEDSCLSHFAWNVGPSLDVPYIVVVHSSAPISITTSINSDRIGSRYDTPLLRASSNRNYNHVVKTVSDISAGSSSSSSGGAPLLLLPDTVTFQQLKSQYIKGNLLGYHGANLWWQDFDKGAARPAFLHCLPRGVPGPLSDGFQGRFEMEKVVVSAMRAVLAERQWDRKVPPAEALLLLDSFGLLEAPHVDEHAHSALGREAFSRLYVNRDKHGNVLDKDKEYSFNRTNLRHFDWLVASAKHRFTLVSTGRGLDSHRPLEVLLMGGIPVMRKSTMASCYDDTDNQINITSVRGSLPVVVVDSWRQVTLQFLEQEWERIVAVPPDRWDSSRLWAPHWFNRVTYWNAQFRSYRVRPGMVRLPAHQSANKEYANLNF